jgi:simple sugar transport system substrate-binding protein
LKEKYPDLKPIGDRLPVGESLDDSFKATQDLLKAHPDLKGIVGFGSQGPIAAAHVLEQQGLVGKVAVVGTVLPKQAAPYLKAGALNAGFLWDPKDAGYAAVAVAKKVLDKQPIDSSLELPGLGKADVDQARRQIKFDQIKTFNADNAASFGF